MGMCTLILEYRNRPGQGLWVAANRDEFYARVASPPFLWSGMPIKLLAPRDEQAGGTWIGFNASGVFAGITNRFGASLQPGARSRGELVLQALSHQSSEDSLAAFSGLSPMDYNGFHLVVMDAQMAFVIFSDGAAVRTRKLQPGVHIFTERSLGEVEAGRERVVRKRVQAVEEFESLVDMLTIHQENMIDGTCLHGDRVGYGTRSSMIVRLDERWCVREARYAQGHPCSSSFEDISTLFYELGPRYLPDSTN